MKPSQPKESAETKVKVEVNKEAKKEPTESKVEEAAQEEEAPWPKAKNHLDLLPPSKMILDEWKRLYSNTKTNFREVAVKETAKSRNKRRSNIKYMKRKILWWHCTKTSTHQRG